METPDECLCSKSELDLFTRPPVNGVMEHGAFQSHFPVSTLAEGAPIEFNVPATPDTYVDLGRTSLHLQLAVRKRDGTVLDNAQQVVPVQNLFGALFQQIDVKLNDRLVTPSLNTYPYKSYIETLLSHGSDAKKSWLTSQGWHGEAGDNPATSNPHDAAAPSGVKARWTMIRTGNDFQLEGRPHVDLFHQERYLVPGVSMHLKLQPTASAFSLMYDPEAQVGGGDQGHFKVVIKRAVLKVRKVRANPDMQLEHAQSLESGKNALYPLRRGVVTTFTVGAGGLSFVKENLVNGQLPRRMFVAMVTNAAYNGTPAANPFQFQHFRLNHLSASVGADTYPSQPFQPNYAEEQYCAVYTDLMRAAGLMNSGRGCAISYRDFVHGGHVIYGFDFTADMAEGPHVDRVKYGSLRLTGQFAAALGAAINVVVYSEYDNLIQIDRARNVVADFSST